jgi:xylulose-5-phosphate/fructose-6-phosphate phosphoketolase
MTVRNDIDRFHLVMDVIDRVPGLGFRAGLLRQRMVDARIESRAYAETYGEDPAEITDWTWSGSGAAG